MSDLKSKFKEGDKVKLKKSSKWYDKSGEDNHNPIKMEGKVLIAHSPSYLRVEWDNGITNAYEEEDLKFVKQKAVEEVLIETPAPGTKYAVLSDLCLWGFGKGDILTFKGVDEDGDWEFEGIDTSCKRPQWLPQHHITSTLRELEVVSEESVEPTFVVGSKYKVISGQDGAFHHFSLGEIVTCIKVYQGRSCCGKPGGNVITKGDFIADDYRSYQIMYPEHVEAVVEVVEEPTVIEESIKPQTPFERKGYTEGMTFKVKQLGGFDFNVGDILALEHDDRSYSPNFKRVFDGKTQYVCLDNIGVVVEKPKTEFEKKGWTKDTLFKVINPSFSVAFTKGDIIKLAVDDGSEICEYERISDGRTKFVRFDDIEVYVAPSPAIENPWIEWKGGEMPVPKGTLVDVKHRDGEVFYGVKAGEYGYARIWSYMYSGCEGNIVAYRISDNASVTSSEALQDTLEEKVGASIGSEQSSVKGLVEPCSTSPTKPSELKGEDLVVGNEYRVIHPSTTGSGYHQFDIGDLVKYVDMSPYSGNPRFENAEGNLQALPLEFVEKVEPSKDIVGEVELVIGDSYEVIGTEGWCFELGDIVTYVGVDTRDGSLDWRFRKGSEYLEQVVYKEGNDSVVNHVKNVDTPKLSFDEISEALRTAISGVLKDKLGGTVESSQALYNPLDVTLTINDIDIKGFSYEGIEQGVRLTEAVGVETFYKLNTGNLDLNNLTRDQLYGLYEKIEEVL